MGSLCLSLLILSSLAPARCWSLGLPSEQINEAITCHSAALWPGPRTPVQPESSWDLLQGFTVELSPATAL